jgi:hypothetical protein
VILLFIELSKNLRYAEDKLDTSNNNNDIYTATRFAKQAKEILEEHDNIKGLDYWADHRKQLKDWAQDILLNAERKK